VTLVTLPFNHFNEEPLLTVPLHTYTSNENSISAIHSIHSAEILIIKLVVVVVVVVVEPALVGTSRLLVSALSSVIIKYW